MKKTILTIIALSTLAFASAATDTLEVKNISKTSSYTLVTFERHFVDGSNDYMMGSMTRAFKGDISNEEVVRKGSLLADDNITVKYGTTTHVGQTFALAKKRQDAFFSSFEAYIIEATRQMLDEQ